MRTVTFKSVYDAILQRLGLDPLGDAITQDTARAITEHITERAATAWGMWDWPQLTLTEERAYRPPWYSTVQYHRAGADRRPDEFYYVSNQKYYKVKAGAPSDPPIGTLPTNTSFFESLDPVPTFIDRDQPGKLPIGQVLGIYKSDPSLNGNAPNDICLKFRPSERGTYICYAPLPTVFICYIVPPPTYTMVPWILGKFYVPGSRVFWPGLGHPYPLDYPGFAEVYRCLAVTNAQPPTDPLFWAREPVPDFFASYLKAGAASDCLKETFTTGEDQVRLARAGALAAEANASIEAEIDALLAHGQKHFYIKPYWSDGWCLSEPWLGSVVLPLTAVAETTIPPPPSAPPAAATMIYRPEIVSLTGPAQPSLQAFPSTSFPIDTLIKITIDTQEQSWRIDPGPKDIADPGQISPADYNAVSNDKHYTKVL